MTENPQPSNEPLPTHSPLPSAYLKLWSNAAGSAQRVDLYPDLNDWMPRDTIITPLYARMPNVEPAQPPLSGNALYEKLIGQCQALWRTNLTVVCTLPKGHDGDHRADCGYTWNGDMDARAAQPPFSLPPLDDDLTAILGRPNFACIGIATRLREHGREIERKAEHEQAAVLHFLLSMYLQHGREVWRSKAEEFLHSSPTKRDAP